MEQVKTTVTKDNEKMFKIPGCIEGEDILAFEYNRKSGNFSIESDGFEFEGKTVLIPFSGNKESAAAMREALENEFDDIKVYDCQLGAIIGSHGGPGLVGFILSDKYNFIDYED